MHGLKKQQHWYTTEYSAAMKKESLPFVIAQMLLETFMLSEISQVVKENYQVISLLSVI